MSLSDAGDAPEEHLQRVYREMLPQVFGYFMVHVSGKVDVAEDLTSETFLHASRHCAKGAADDVTPAWVMTVAKRRMVDHWRRRSSAQRRAARLAAEAGCHLGVEGTEAGGELSAGEVERVYRALDSLHADQRLVLVLKHFDNESVQSIAQTISRTPKATESLLGRSRQAFRSAYTTDSESDRPRLPGGGRHG